MKSNLSKVVSNYSNYKVFNVFLKAIYRSVHFSVTSVCNEHLSLLVNNIFRHINNDVSDYVNVFLLEKYGK